MMNRRIRALIAEDNPADAELMLRELRRAGFEIDSHRVETESEFLRHLRPEPDIILSDYAMPQFSGLHALELVNQQGLDTPFIIVSGTIGEEIAVTTMKKGAADYLLKDRLTRLGAAVAQALQQKKLRDERKQADEALGRLRHHHELILNSAGEGIFGLDLQEKIFFMNPKAGELLGWSNVDILGQPAQVILRQIQANQGKLPSELHPVNSIMREGGIRRVNNDVFWRKDGTSFRVDYVAAPIKDEKSRISGSIVTFRDITEQFAAEARLKLQAQQYRLLFDTNPNAMCIFDAKSLEILAVNDAACRQYGYSQDEFLRLNFKDLQPGGNVTDIVAPSSDSPFEPSPNYRGRFQNNRKDGSLMPVDIYSGAIIWSGVAARVVTAIDMTPTGISAAPKAAR